MLFGSVLGHLEASQGISGILGALGEFRGIPGLLGEAQPQILIETLMDFINFYIERFSQSAQKLPPELPPHFGAFQIRTQTIFKRHTNHTSPHLMSSCGTHDQHVIAHVTAHVTCMCVTCHIICHVSSSCASCVVAHAVVYHSVSHMPDVIMRVTSGVSQVIVHVTCCHACHTIVSCCRAITMCMCVCGAAGHDTIHIACAVIIQFMCHGAYHMSSERVMYIPGHISQTIMSCMRNIAHMTRQCIPSHTSHVITRIQRHTDHRSPQLMSSCGAHDQVVIAHVSAHVTCMFVTCHIICHVFTLCAS